MIDALGRVPGVTDRRRQQVGADYVAADEHAWALRRAPPCVGGGGALAVVDRLQSGEVAGLADCGDDHVALDVSFGALLDHHLAARPIDLDDPQSFGVAGRVERHRDGRERAEDLHALSRHLLDFGFRSGHFLDRTSVDDGHVRALPLGGRGGVVGCLAEHDVFGPVLFVDLRDMSEPARHGGDVHGGVAAADDQHASSADLEPAFVEGFQEGDAADAVGRFLRPGHGERRSALRAGSDEHRVVIALQFIERDVHADLDACAHLDPQVENALDFAVEHVARRAIAGNAVAHHAAEFGARLEYRAGVAFAAQEIGGG